MNHVDLIGNIATDVKLQYNSDGKPWAAFNLGYTRRKPGGDQSCFVGVICFGQLAENVSKYCAKGRQLAVSGELEVTNTKRDDGGYTTQARIIAQAIDFLGQSDKR